MAEDGTIAPMDAEVSAELSKAITAYPLPDGVPDADMNIDEFASAMGSTVNTVSKWIKDQTESPRFPVAQVGGPGKAYVLRLSHCYAWKMNRDQAETSRLKNNQSAIEALQASFLGIDLDAPGATLSPKDRRTLAEADLMHNKAAMVRRQLVPLNEVTDLLESLLKIVRDGLESLPDRLERELSLKPEEVVRAKLIGDDVLNSIADRIEEAELQERDISDAEIPSQLLI